MLIKNIIEGKYDIKSFDQEGEFTVPTDEEKFLSKVSNVANFIYDNCRPWLNATRKGKLVVYRGFFSGPEDSVFTKAVRQLRKPKDSSVSQTKNMQKLIASAGLKANRHNSIFASGYPGVAEMYGTVYVVLPIGEFNWSSNKELDDWWGGTGPTDWNSFYKTPPNLYAERERNRIIKGMIGGNNQYTGLGTAINSGHEIMINCDKIIAINPDLYTRMVLPTLLDQSIPADTLRYYDGGI